MHAPPTDTAELCARAAALAGVRLTTLADALGASLDGKGKVGELVERALGATAGNAATPDFPALGVELKTVPIDGRGAPRESTYVCTAPLADADRAEWTTSRVRQKL